jgi:hypothetical protein
LNARENPITKLTNLPDGRNLAEIDIFIDDLNLKSSEIYKKFLNESIKELDNRKENYNQSMKEIKNRLDMFNLKLVSRGKQKEIQSQNVNTVPMGPVNMIKDYLTDVKGGRSKRNKKNKRKTKRKKNN